MSHVGGVFMLSFPTAADVFKCFMCAWGSIVHMWHAFLLLLCSPCCQISMCSTSMWCWLSICVHSHLYIFHVYHLCLLLVLCVFNSDSLWVCHVVQIFLLSVLFSNVFCLAADSFPHCPVCLLLIFMCDKCSLFIFLLSGCCVCLTWSCVPAVGFHACSCLPAAGAFIYFMSACCWLVHVVEVCMLFLFFIFLLPVCLLFWHTGPLCIWLIVHTHPVLAACRCFIICSVCLLLICSYVFCLISVVFSHVSFLPAVGFSTCACLSADGPFLSDLPACSWFVHMVYVCMLVLVLMLLLPQCLWRLTHILCACCWLFIHILSCSCWSSRCCMCACCCFLSMLPQTLYYCLFHVCLLMSPSSFKSTCCSCCFCFVMIAFCLAFVCLLLFVFDSDSMWVCHAVFISLMSCCLFLSTLSCLSAVDVPVCQACPFHNSSVWLLFMLTCVPLCLLLVLLFVYVCLLLVLPYLSCLSAADWFQRSMSACCPGFAYVSCHCVLCCHACALCMLLIDHAYPVWQLVDAWQSSCLPAEELFLCLLSGCCCVFTCVMYPSCCCCFTCSCLLAVDPFLSELSACSWFVHMFHVCLLLLVFMCLLPICFHVVHVCLLLVCLHSSCLRTSVCFMYFLPACWCLLMGSMCACCCFKCLSNPLAVRSFDLTWLTAA